MENAESRYIIKHFFIDIVILFSSKRHHAKICLLKLRFQSSRYIRAHSYLLVLLVLNMETIGKVSCSPNVIWNLTLQTITALNVCKIQVANEQLNINYTSVPSQRQMAF